MCKKDLFFLAEHILRNKSAEPVALDDEYHGDECDWLMMPGARKFLGAPRGTLKSTVGNRSYTIWRIINNPDITILITSATLDNAKKKLRAIQSVFEKNLMFRWLFPELIPASFNKGWTQTEMLVPRSATDPEYTVEVQGVEGELTSRHYDLIIDDDVVGKENSATKDQIDKVKNYYTQSLSLLKKPHGERLVIGTLWNYADLYNHILENLYSQYDVYVRSIWKDERFVRGDDGRYEWTKSDLRRSLYPAMMDLDAIGKLKEEIIADPNQGISTWMAQYELKIVDDATAVFKRSKSLDNGFYFTLDDLYEKKLAFTLACDPAVSEKKQADQTAFTVRAVDESDNWYVVEVFAQIGMEENDIIDKYVELLQKYPIDLCTFETKSFQRNIQYAIERRCRELKIFLPYMKLPAGHDNASKNESDMKIRGLASPYATGKLHFLKNDFHTEQLLDQLWRFPKASHDDYIDSLSMHIHLPVFATRIWKTKEEIIVDNNIGRDRYGRITQNNKTGKYL